MLEELKNRLINSLPFYTGDFSDSIKIESIEKFEDTLTLNLEEEFDVSNIPSDFSIVVSGLYSSWNLNLNPSIGVQQNRLCLTVETNESCYLDQESCINGTASYLEYYLSGVEIISQDFTLTKEIKGYVKILSISNRRDENQNLIKKLTIAISRDILSLSEWKQFVNLGYILDITNAKISFINLMDKKFLGINRILNFQDIIQNENKAQISYKINAEEQNPIILPITVPEIRFNHRIYKTGIALNNFDLLLTEHLQNNGEIEPLNTIYLSDGGSTALTNLNSASGQDGDGSFYTRRQRTFTILLLIPNTPIDNVNRSIYLDSMEAANFYATKIIYDLQGYSILTEVEKIVNITLLDNFQIPTNNPNIFAKSLTFQSTSIFSDIRIKEKNPTPTLKSICSLNQTNQNKDTYLITKVYDDKQ